MQPLALLAVGREPPGGILVAIKSGLDRPASIGGERTIEMAVQFVFRDRFGCHRQHTSSMPDAGSPAVNCRNRSRPRASRDITVPIGTPRIAAASA